MNDQSQITDEADFVAPPSDDPKDLLRQAREMIPVGRTGTAPMNLAQQVDFAQTMAKARSAIPDHLKTNVGDCLAIVDISTRAGLSPYMVAMKTYVQSGRLCFESQLYHAFAQASGLLRGDLMVAYEGDGDDLVCIVTGYLRGDPQLKIHRSERLADARPPLNEKGQIKGSPLWLRKPKVQLFYDTSRDWVRIYAPRATLGIYTPDEIEEFGPEFARDVTPPGLNSRLAIAPKSDEGHAPGHAEAELAAIAPNAPHMQWAGRVEAVEEGRAPEPAPRRIKRASKAPNRGKTVAKIKKEAKTPAPSMDSKPPPRGANGPETVAAYIVWASAWIHECKTTDQLQEKWNDERKLRNKLGMTENDRAPLLDTIAKRRAELEK